MTQVAINEDTIQGKSLLSLIKTMPKKVVTFLTVDEENIDDCISSEEFEKKLISSLKKKYKK